MQNTQMANMDSVFLKSDFEGQLITLCIKYDNKKILVEKEDESNYTYLLGNCMRRSAFAATFNSPDITVLVPLSWRAARRPR